MEKYEQYKAESFDDPDWDPELIHRVINLWLDRRELPRYITDEFAQEYL